MTYNYADYFVLNYYVGTLMERERGVLPPYCLLTLEAFLCQVRYQARYDDNLYFFSVFFFFLKNKLVKFVVVNVNR